MGGVDHNDQLRQYYCLNTRGYKAYMYIFYFVTDVVITNTYLLQTFLPTSPFKTIKDFCLNLGHLLIGLDCGRKRPGLTSLCLPVKNFVGTIFLESTMEVDTSVTTVMHF